MMHRAKIKYVQTFGKLAKIEGSAECADTAVKLELAMTDTPAGRVKGVVKRSLAFADLEDVALRRRIFRRSQLVFTARNLETFESVPGAKGYEYIVTPVAPISAARSFVTEARLAIAQATMEEFTKQIEDSQL